MAAIALLMGVNGDVVTSDDVRLTDVSPGPGYGQMNAETRAAITRTAQTEGLFLDPVYTGKVMAGLIDLAKSNALAGPRVLFWHTGGQLALFGYADQF